MSYSEKLNIILMKEKAQIMRFIESLGLSDEDIQKCIKTGILSRFTCIYSIEIESLNTNNFDPISSMSKSQLSYTNKMKSSCCCHPTKKSMCSSKFTKGKHKVRYILLRPYRIIQN